MSSFTSSVAMQGIRSLSDVPSALAAAYSRGQSGFLHFRRERERRSLRFREGRIVYASTNVAQDHLGETLVRHGWLRAEDLAAASAVMGRDGRRLGAVLVAMGFLDGARLGEALMLHARAVVGGLFTWNAGGYEFETDRTTPPAHGTEGDSHTVELIADAARRLADEAAIRTALGDLDRTLRVGDVAPRRRPLTLGETEAFVLRQADGSRTAREIAGLRPEATREVLGSMLTLLCIGLLEWSSPPGRAADPGPLETTAAFEAHDALARAEAFVSIERYWEAIQILERLLPRMGPSEARLAARVLLARAYLQNPKWVRKAEEALQAALQEDPRRVEALFLLGRLYRGQGLHRRAEALLRRVLELEPAHGPTAAELKALGGSPLLKKLFGKPPTS
jgi:tetratricopeptide (TPR) repeat protein